MHPRRTRLGGCCALASCLISSCSPCSLCRFTARSCDCCALLLALFPCPVPRYLQLGSTVLLETRRLVRFSRALRPRQRYAAASLCPSFKVYGTALPAACDCVLSRGAPRLCSNARASCCPIAVRGVNWSCAPLLLALQLGLWCLPVEVLLLRARAANCNAMPVFCFVSPPSNPSFWRARPSCHARKREFCRPERVGKRRGGGRLRTLRCDGGVAQATAQRCCAVGGVGHELQL